MIGVAETKYYEVEGFRFGFIPDGSPMRGTLRTECPEREPYAAYLHLAKARERERYAKEAAERLGENAERVAGVIADLCSARFEEVAAATGAEGDDEEAAPGIPYRQTPYGLVLEKPTKDGLVDVPLTNFSARIVGDVVEDDGAEQRRSFEIEAELRGSGSSFSVPAERFSVMAWPSEHLGASAIVYPGFGTKDHARAAIQMVSGDVPLRRLYAHTGWRRIGEEWAYLHAGGPIGSEGPLTGVEVSLGDGRLGDYLLPAPPSGDDLVRAVCASLRFLELAPLPITVPLLAAAYRAPLGEAAPVDLSLALVGPTGTQKTELTAMAQAHYGAAFDGRCLPANWTSTENALEKLAFAGEGRPPRRGRLRPRRHPLRRDAAA